MAEYRLLIEEEAHDFIESLDQKTRRIVKDNVSKLATDPYPGSGKGDKEKVVTKGEEAYRLHIGRTFTAFYNIDENEEAVRVLAIVPIDKAHKWYDR